MATLTDVTATELKIVNEAKTLAVTSQTLEWRPRLQSAWLYDVAVEARATVPLAELLVPGVGESLDAARRRWVTAPRGVARYDVPVDPPDDAQTANLYYVPFDPDRLPSLEWAGDDLPRVQSVFQERLAGSTRWMPSKRLGWFVSVWFGYVRTKPEKPPIDWDARGATVAAIHAKAEEERMKNSFYREHVARTGRPTPFQPLVVPGRN